MITENEISTARACLGHALEAGASKARITLEKNTMDLVSILDGKVDKVTHCMDRSMTISLFADGRYGSFSANNLEPEFLKGFICSAVKTVRMLAPDTCRDLPASERKQTGAVTGTEMGTYDDTYSTFTPDERKRIALGLSLHSPAGGCNLKGKGWKLVSEEGEYSDSEDDCIIIDTDGLFCRHSETAFDYGVEVTVQASGGRRYSSYAWHSSPFFKSFEGGPCGRRALDKAVAQIGSREFPAGKYRMVVDSDVASRLLKPVLEALSGYSIQQNNSFLMNAVGRKAFSEGMTLRDVCHRPGELGSRLFDSEGVRTREHDIIRGGVVQEYFINTYMAAKLQMQPTVEDPQRVMLEGWPREGLMRDDILKICGEGILVTDFNGGNSSPATGDFSYGISGFAFKDGRITRPVSEMLITGNFRDLWNNLLAVGSDARVCMSKLIPTLAFENVNFSG